MMHRGRTYQFASHEAMQKFRSDPDRYSPVLSGFDVVRYVDAAAPAVGRRRHGMWFHGKMYLFSDEASLDRFLRSPEYYEQRAFEVMVNGRR
jgi:YHS domain-containing protein